MVRRLLKGYPDGLREVLSMESGAIFSFRGLQAIFLFYFMKDFGLAEDIAYPLFASFGTFTYALPFIEGHIKDAFLKLHHTLIFGSICMVLGYLLLLTPAYILALTLIVIGNGFYKPSLPALIGKLYDENPSLDREQGFAAHSFWINFLSLSASFIVGGIGGSWGWYYSVMIICVGIVGSAIACLLFLKKNSYISMGPTQNIHYVFALVSMIFGGVYYLLHHLQYMPLMIGFLVLSMIVYGVILYRKTLVSDHNDIKGIYLLCVWSILFWMLLNQGYFSINLITQYEVDRHFLGFEVPSPWLLALNGLIIVVLIPVFAMVWQKLKENGHVVTVPERFVYGFYFAALAFIAMVIGLYTSAPSGKIALIWPVLFHLLMTIGEAFHLPIFASVVTKIAPKQFSSGLIGFYFLSMSFAQYLMAPVATYLYPSHETLSGAPDMHALDAAPFLHVTILILLLATFLHMMVPWSKKFFKTYHD